MSNYAEQKFNIFTLDELAHIQKILSYIKDQPLGTRDIYTNGFTPADPVYKILKPLVIDRINEHFEQKITDLTVGMQLISQEPFGPHSDFAGKKDHGYGCAYLIPLYMKQTGSAKSATVVFDQIWHQQSIKEYIDTNPEKPKNNARSIWPEYLGRWPIEWADYLSVKLVGHWDLGSVIAWDRELIHSSDDFLSKGITEKSALILFAKTPG